LQQTRTIVKITSPNPNSKRGGRNKKETGKWSVLDKTQKR